MKNFKLGLCSVSFRGHDPEEIVSEAKKSGLECIEWGSDVHAPCKDTKKLNSIAQLQNESGIYCSSYGTYFYIMRDKPEELKDYINAAKILGTNILRLWCGEKGSAQFTENEKEELFSHCKKLAEIAKNEGVVLCMECHAGTYCDTLQTSTELIERVNSPHFKMYWQPYVKLSDSENVECAKLLSSHTVNLHMTPRPLSEGKTVWEQYLKEFDGEKTLLLEFMPDGKLTSLATEAKTLKELCLN